MINYCTNLKMVLKKLKWKKFLAATAAGIICLGTAGGLWQGGISYAAEVSDKKTEELTAEEKLQAELDAAYAIPTESNSWEGWAKGPGTYGEAAIVMEVETGTILYAKDIDSAQYPASITKVLTALVALEHSQMSDKVTFSHDSVAFLQPGDSSVGLKEGNVITMEQALYATLLASANEAAYAVGENTGTNLGYDYDWFIRQMNERVQELGGVNSNFVNTNGLHDKNHYTCARDMGLIGRELFQYPEFFKIVQTLEYTIPKSDTVEKHVFQQKHKMLQPQNENYYKYAIGGKTGYTSDALSTLITMADNGEMQLVCVVLRTHGKNIYPDTTKLLNYGFENFKKMDVSKLSETEGVEEVITGDACVVVPEKADAGKIETQITPDGTGSEEGTLTYTYSGREVGAVRVKLTEEYLKANSLIEEKPEISDSGKHSDRKTSGEPDWLIKLKKLDKPGILEKTGIDERLCEMSHRELLVLGAAVATFAVLVILFLICFILLLKKTGRRKRFS